MPQSYEVPGLIPRRPRCCEELTRGSAKGASVGGRGRSHAPLELHAQSCRGTEARLRSDLLDGELRRLEQPLREQDALAEDPSVRSRTCDRAESPREVARAHARLG